jgi:large subunit ribosomal protein L3
MTGTEKKTPDIVEVAISGSPEKQLAYAKEKLGKELSISEVFKEKQFVDIKAVTKGKGFQGVVKRFGIKMHRPKAKKRRIVGSIGPWNPSTVMWTVARAGQMGYHTRTEFNKRILYLGNNPADVNPGGGFNNYGDVKSTYIILSGSTAGPEKRAVALRDTMRKPHDKKYQISGILYLSTKKGLSEETKKKEAEKIKEAAEQAAAEEAAARAGMPAPPKKTKRH